MDTTTAILALLVFIPPMAYVRQRTWNFNAYDGIVMSLGITEIAVGWLVGLHIEEKE
jgi:hypothetical protein